MNDNSIQCCLSHTRPATPHPTQPSPTHYFPFLTHNLLPFCVLYTALIQPEESMPAFPPLLSYLFCPVQCMRDILFLDCLSEHTIGTIYTLCITGQVPPPLFFSQYPALKVIGFIFLLMQIIEQKVRISSVLELRYRLNPFPRLR